MFSTRFGSKVFFLTIFYNYTIRKACFAWHHIVAYLFHPDLNPDPPHCKGCCMPDRGITAKQAQTSSCKLPDIVTSSSSLHHHHPKISSSLLFDNCGYCQPLTMLSQQLLLDHHNDDRRVHHVDHQVNMSLCHYANHHGGGRRRRRRACRKANIAQIVQT